MCKIRAIGDIVFLRVEQSRALEARGSEGDVMNPTAASRDWRENFIIAIK